MSIAGLRGPERKEPGQPGVLPGSNDAGEVRLVTPGSEGFPGVSEGFPKAFSNGLGSLEKWALPLELVKYSPSPFCDGFGGGASGAFDVDAALSLLLLLPVSSSGCLMDGTVDSKPKLADCFLIKTNQA